MQATTYKLKAYSNGTILVLAHVKFLTGATVPVSDLSSIRYTVYSMGYHENGARTAITGHNHVLLPKNDVFGALDTITINGQEISHNFHWTLDNSENEPFPDPHSKYLLRLDFTPSHGYISPVQILVETI